jgi:hypothetical protein
LRHGKSIPIPVRQLHRTADRHGADELAFGFGEDLVHLGRRQDQRVTGLVAYFTIGHRRPAASLQEQDHFLRIVAVRRSRRIGVHAAVPHLDLLRAEHIPARIPWIHLEGLHTPGAALGSDRLQLLGGFPPSSSPCY